MSDVTPPQTPQDFAAKIVEESAQDLQEAIQNLGGAAQPVFEKAKDLATLMIQVYRAQLNGENTAIAEVAMVGIMKNLQAAGSIYVATEALNFAEKLLDRLKKAVIAAVVAAV